MFVCIVFVCLGDVLSFSFLFFFAIPQLLASFGFFLLAFIFGEVSVRLFLFTGLFLSPFSFYQPPFYLLSGQAQLH